MNLTEDEDLIECGNTKCKKGRWFHPKCTGMEDVEVPDEWYCGAECKNDGNAFCVCREKKDDNIIQCMAGDKCVRGQKFHMTCIGYLPGFDSKGKVAIMQWSYSSLNH